MLKHTWSFFRGSSLAREQLRAIDKKMWLEYIGKRGRGACFAMLFLRGIAYLMIGAFAAMGFLLAVLPGVSIDSLALPFFFLWHRAPPFIMLLPLFAILGCVKHVYARAGIKMAKSSLSEES